MLGNELLRYNFNNKTFCVFDFETENLNLSYALPWQIAWILYKGEKEIDCKILYLDWENLNVSDGAAKITHFDPVIIKEKGVDPKRAIDEFCEVLYNPEIYSIGANILSYDVMILNHCRKRLGYKTDYSFLDRAYDTNALSKAYKLGKKIDQENFLAQQFELQNYRKKGLTSNVGAMCKEFNIPFEESKRHEARYDSELTFSIFKQLIWKLEIA